MSVDNKKSFSATATRLSIELPKRFTVKSGSRGFTSIKEDTCVEPS